MIEIETLGTADEAAAASRSKIYRILAQTWQHPGAEFIELVKDGSFFEGIRGMTEDLPFPIHVSEEGLGGGTLRDVSADDFEAEFIRVFDMGPGGPPCPLREALYHGGRKSIMEELVRFYNHFGLSTTKGEEKELPDTLTTELEFMHYLAFKEIVAIQHDQDPGAYLRAERDFLERHVAKWLPLLNQRLADFLERDYKKVNRIVVEFYKALVDFMEGFVRYDLVYITGRCASGE